MTILKREQKALKSKWVDDETGDYFIMRKWLTRLYKVVDRDQPDSVKPWIIDGECKLLYSYLFNFGKHYGWDKIYPNQDLMSEELGIPISTLKRKIKTLGNCGLIDVIKQKDVGTYWSNRYRVKKPSLVPRRRWLDVNQEELKGKLYRYDSSVFRKTFNG